MATPPWAPWRLFRHVQQPTDAHNAAAIQFEPTGTIVGETIQDAVVEVAADAAVATEEVADDLAAHLADTIGAHTASAISFNNGPSGLTADDVQEAVDEVVGLIEDLGTMSAQDANAVNIDGGTIDDTAIGAGTADTGKFTTLEATDNITASTLGKGLRIKVGTNGRLGNAVLVGGTVTVACPSISSTTSYILLTRKTSGGVVSTELTYTITDATDFTINAGALDTSTITYLVIDAA